MRRRDPGFAAVILAAQRAGQVDPLAEAVGLSHKCLVPIADAPLIVHVARALFATPGCALVRIVVEPGMFGAIDLELADRTIPIEFVPSAVNLADSVFAGAEGIDGPIIVTTADNVLLTSGAVTQMLDQLHGGAEVALAMASKGSVLAAHPEGQRRFYRFRDGEYSNCNLYGFNGRQALAAAESFRSGGQFAKKPLRLIAAVGVVNVVLMLLHRLSLPGALRRLSRRFLLRIEPVVLADGTHAIDVDNDRTYRVATILLERRQAEAATAGVRRRTVAA